EAMDRHHPFHRAVRIPTRAITQGLSLVGRGLRRVMTGPEPDAPAMKDEAQARLQEGVAELLEQLAPELRGWKEDPEGARLLESLLASGTHTEALPEPPAGDRRADEARFT